MNRLIIVGASGHGKVVADIAKMTGYEDIVFLDNDSKITSCEGYPVLGPDNNIGMFDGDVFVAVGNASVRRRIMEREKNRHFPILIHPSAIIAESVEIGAGTVVVAGTVINPGVSIGKGCIVNTSSSIDHDCVIGDYTHVSVGAHLCGTVVIGKENWIGAGAIISNNHSICDGCIIGAGAVVVNDLDEPGTYFGVPAKRKAE